MLLYFPRGVSKLVMLILMRARFYNKKGGVKDIISYCLSSEGVHILSKPDNVHIYYSLDYDVEANYSDEVYK